MNAILNFLFSKTPLYFITQSLWRDEAFSYLLAKKDMIEIFALTAKDFNPPLYYLILHLWIKIFGPSEISLRSLSLIFYWATIYIFYLFLINVLKIKSRRFAFLYLIFAITNPLLVYYGFEARMYSLFAFLATLSFYALKINNQKLHLISTILGLFTHYFMIFVILAQVFYLFIFKEKKANHFLNHLKKNYLISFLFFFPWLFFVFIQKNGFIFQSFWIKKINLTNFISFLALIYTDYEKGFNYFNNFIFKLGIFFNFLVILLFLKNLKAKKEEKKLFYFFLFWGILLPFLIILISFMRPIFLPRYLIFSTIGFLLFLILCLEKIPNNLKILFLTILITFNFIYNFSQVSYRKKFDIKKVIREIKILAKENDLLYVTSELNFHETQYYFDERRVFIYNKTYEEIPNYVGKVLIPKEKLIYQLPIYPTKAFILFPNGRYEIQAMF